MIVSNGVGALLFIFFVIPSGLMSLVTFYWLISSDQVYDITRRLAENNFGFCFAIFLFLLITISLITKRNNTVKRRQEKKYFQMDDNIPNKPTKYEERPSDKRKSSHDNIDGLR